MVFLLEQLRPPLGETNSREVREEFPSHPPEVCTRGIVATVVLSFRSVPGGKSGKLAEVVTQSDFAEIQGKHHSLIFYNVVLVPEQPLPTCSVCVYLTGCPSIPRVSYDKPLSLGLR